MTLVLRKSGHVDLYWNCKRITSTEESDKSQFYLYTSITMSFNAAYLTRKVNPAAAAMVEAENMEVEEHLVLLELN